MLRLLIDTSAWLDMAMRRDGQKWIVPLRVLKSQGKLELLVPALIIEEFDRNRPRSEAAVTASVLSRLRQLRRELHEYAGDKHEHVWLAETAQHIPLVNATAPQNFREIDELLRAGTILEPAEREYARAVQRGLGKRAPFTSDKNSVADALLIEIYASQVPGAGGSDVYVFVTSNYRDFSVPDGDRRQPHPDLAGLFDGTRSRYADGVEGLHEADQPGRAHPPLRGGLGVRQGEEPADLRRAVRLPGPLPGQGRSAGYSCGTTRRPMNRRFVRSVRRATGDRPGAHRVNRSVTDGCSSTSGTGSRPSGIA